MNDEDPQLIKYNPEEMTENYNGSIPITWKQNVADNIKIITTDFEIEHPGNHTLNYF